MFESLPRHRLDDHRPAHDHDHTKHAMLHIRVTSSGQEMQHDKPERCHDGLDHYGPRTCLTPIFEGTHSYFSSKIGVKWVLGGYTALFDHCSWRRAHVMTKMQAGQVPAEEHDPKEALVDRGSRAYRCERHLHSRRQTLR